MSITTKKKLKFFIGVRDGVAQIELQTTNDPL